MTSFTMGDTAFTVVSDGPLELGPAHVCFAPLSEAEAIAELGAAMAADVTLAQNLLVADDGERRILFESGLGPTYTGPVGRDAGRGLENLGAAGIEPGSIDVIALSHSHFDHVGGLLLADGVAAFPDAEVVLSRGEYEDVMADPEGEEPGSFTARQRVFARNCLAPYDGRVRALDDGDELVPGVTLLASPGHSPGHCAFAVDTAEGRLVTWGDTCHDELLVRRPELGFSADFDSPRAADSRRRLLGRIAEGGWRVHAYHFPSPGLGTVRSGPEGSYAWVADADSSERR